MTEPPEWRIPPPGKRKVVPAFEDPGHNVEREEERTKCGRLLTPSGVKLHEKLCSACGGSKEYIEWREARRRLTSTPTNMASGDGSGSREAGVVASPSPAAPTGPKPIELLNRDGRSIGGCARQVYEALSETEPLSETELSVLLVIDRKKVHNALTQLNRRRYARHEKRGRFIFWLKRRVD